MSQRVVVGATGTLQYGVGYSYRRDMARYHEGTKITRMTVPSSEVRELGARAGRSVSYADTARMRLQGVSFVLRAGTR